MITGLSLVFVGLIDLCSTYSVTGVEVPSLRQIARDSVDIRTRQEPLVVRRKWKRLGDEARVAVIKRYEAGETSSALAAEYGVAKSTILGILRTNNVCRGQTAATDLRAGRGSGSAIRIRIITFASRRAIERESGDHANGNQGSGGQPSSFNWASRPVNEIDVGGLRQHYEKNPHKYRTKFRMFDTIDTN